MITLGDNQVLDLTKGEVVYERECKKVLTSNSTTIDSSVQEPLTCDCMVEIAKQDSEQQWQELNNDMACGCEAVEVQPEMQVVSGCDFGPIKYNPPVIAPLPFFYEKETKVEESPCSCKSRVISSIDARLEAFRSLGMTTMPEIKGQTTALEWVRKLLTEG